jgi:peptidyl-prolyl cis-trans isomerase D
MLSALRRLAGTFVAKALFVLLILSFGVWGIGDVVRNFGADTAIARVDGRPIELPEAQAAMRREMQRLSRTLGAQFENDPRVRQAVARQAVDSIVMDLVLRREAERLGIAVPDQAVRDFIYGIEAFKGADGRFSRPLFENFLRSSNLSEGEFLAAVRADLARQQMSTAIVAGATVPDALAKPLRQWEGETRTATLVTLRDADAPAPPTPEEQALRRFHANNAERFSAPEYRKAQVAVLTAERIVKEVEVSDAEIAAAFQQRRGQFEKPERRQVEQALVQDEAKAREIAAAWRDGADFQKVAAMAGAAGGQAVGLGEVAKDALPLPELADAAFALPAGGVSDPVHTALGWHVLRVTAVEPAAEKTLAEVHDQLRDTLAQEKAADLAFERANKVEDALAGGATLAEAAKQFNLGFAEVETDADGRDPKGEEVALPVIPAARAAVLRSIFAAQHGEAPRLQENEAGFVGVQVTEIIPPALKPFEQVEAEVRAAWEADAKRHEQEERAAALLAAAKGGKPLAEAAAAAGLGSREVGDLTRTGRDQPVPRELLAPLFELKPHEATMVRTADGFTVAQVQEITRPDPGADPAALEQTKQQTEQAMARDLEVQYLAALRARADVRVNERMVAQLAQP